MTKQRKIVARQDALDRAAHKLGLAVSSFRLGNDRLYYLRNSNGLLLNDGWSMDLGEVLGVLEAEKAAVAAVACLNGKSHYR